MSLRQLFLNFDGRINRARYWGAIGILLLVAVVIAILEILLSSATSEKVGSDVGFGLNLIAAIPSLAVTAKRLHDRDLSAWWTLLLLAPLPLVIIGMHFQSGLVIAIILLTFSGLGIWLFVQTGCLRGTVGPNRFGPDPLGEPERWI